MSPGKWLFICILIVLNYKAPVPTYVTMTRKAINSFKLQSTGAYLRYNDT